MATVKRADKANRVARRTGGALAFLGSLVYLYILFAWYGRGAMPSEWTLSASFLAPFVVATATLSAVILFFMSIGFIADTWKGDRAQGSTLWKLIIISGAAFIILGGFSWFYVALIGFVLAFVGGIISVA